ncbi:MAG TPA: hypothetical protein VIG86_05780 [Candidatus Dormibacteraeota bacterium]|jgi:hypothetical protein
MRRAALTNLICAGATAALAACGSSAAPAPLATPAGASATPAPAQRTDLQVVYTLIYPPTSSGGDCFQANGGPAATASCPFTSRLTAAVAAAIAAQTSGGGADPVCGCQNVDPSQTATYTVGTPPRGGTILVTSFGSLHVVYVVIWSGNAFLVDDIIYCTPAVTSVYPGETPSGC